MKIPEIYYLQHKKSGNVVVVDKNNRFIQIYYLNLSKIGRKIRLKKNRIIEFVYSAYYFKLKRQEVLRLLKKNNISLDLLSFQTTLFNNQLSLF